MTTADLEKRLAPSQQRRVLTRAFRGIGEALPAYLQHIGLKPEALQDGDAVAALLAHYLLPSGHYAMALAATDLVNWKPIVASFDRIVQR